MHIQMERLYEAAKTLHGLEGQSDIARALNSSPQTINNWEARGISKAGMLSAQAVFGCSATWLDTGEGPMVLASGAPAIPLPAGARRVRAADPDDPNIAQIRKVQLRVSAGIMGFTVDPEYDDGETLSLDLRWIARKKLRPENLVAIAVKGESMEPSLYEDDIVFIDTSEQGKAKQDGVVYVFNYEGEVVIKRLSRDVGEWWLASDSPDQRKYHRKVCRDRECIIVGRVVRKESDRI